MSMGGRHSPEQVLDNFQTFTKLVHAGLPKTKIFFISIKPSKSRWEYWKHMNRANELIKDYTQLDNRLGFFDISPLMLDADGVANDDLLVWDGIHMNSKGYELWKSLIKPVLLSENN